MYIAAGETLTIVDVSNPAAPRKRATPTFEDRIWGSTVVDNLVDVAVDLLGVGIVDVSNPDAPMLRTLAKTRGQAHGVAASGTRLLVADHMVGVDF